MAVLDADDPRAVAVTAAIRSGDVPALRKLLAAHPGLAASWIRREGEAAGTRSLLHIATDWPGHLPAGPEVIGVLVAAGADPGARFVGAHRETPLHWAASSDDVAAIDALLAAGADIEADGAVIEGGTPLADARGFGQWRAARRLLERGARTTLRDEAALGLLDRVRARVTAQPPPAADDLDAAFWDACHGGQPATARLLLERGAALDRVGYDGMTPLDIAVAVAADDVVAWLRGQGARTGAGAEP
ncbi:MULTISPECIES: ankyrin repeat domain-containing protein [Streptomyces]|uniref:ankyrin repeat domain-containing protein n=1 Tax=Streptomyces TaxID=1883 RepID=UPI001E64180E|nr:MULTISPECIES: ankyrin repeat domain-containing protein [Streptomyces]UFQ16703.1 ankyrin repeat domain-containing protein [Streptomyces huasconensis]WCL86303.1 ankyrin repeat domain-containing protein [Streptomyces sp. JCM 35825]